VHLVRPAAQARPAGARARRAARQASIRVTESPMLIFSVNTDSHRQSLTIRCGVRLLRAVGHRAQRCSAHSISYSHTFFHYRR